MILKLTLVLLPIQPVKINQLELILIEFLKKLG